MKTEIFYVVDENEKGALAHLKELATLMQLWHRDIPPANISALHRVLDGRFTKADMDMTSEAFTLAAVERKRAEDVLDREIKLRPGVLVVDVARILATDRESIMSRWVSLRADFYGMLLCAGAPAWSPGTPHLANPNLPPDAEGQYWTVDCGDRDWIHASVHGVTADEAREKARKVCAAS